MSSVVRLKGVHVKKGKCDTTKASWKPFKRLLFQSLDFRSNHERLLSPLLLPRRLKTALVSGVSDRLLVPLLFKPRLDSDSKESKVERVGVTPEDLLQPLHPLCSKGDTPLYMLSESSSVPRRSTFIAAPFRAKFPPALAGRAAPAPTAVVRLRIAREAAEEDPGLCKGEAGVEWPDPLILLCCIFKFILLTFSILLLP